MVTLEAEADDIDGARYEEFALRSGPVTIHLALFRPPGTDRGPVILALNKCGNQSLSGDTRVRPTTSGLLDACNGSAGETRDERGESWPIRAIVERGYTLATFHESDVRLDARDAEGPFASIPVDAPDEAKWGALAQWAWGLQRAVDYLTDDDRIDPNQIVVTGHSRRGKAALWAAAQDERIAVVAPHQSGTGGATMARGGTGEPLNIITLFFPFWFAPNYTDFAEAVPRLPVDQHLLLALVAPRGLVSTNGVEDGWADPEGALRAARLASPAWSLLGARGLEEVDGVPTFEGALSWHVRDGGHSLDAEDWTTFLDFSDVRFGR